MRTLERGQTLVVLLLILVVTLTVGLSVVSRTITNVRESSTTERSSRAFSAAEAGIEATLRQDLPTLIGNGSTANLSFDLGTGTSNVTVTKTGGSTAYQPSKAINRDDVIQLDVDTSAISTSPATAVLIYWSQSDAASGENPTASCTAAVGGIPAALEASVYYNHTTAPISYDVYRYAINPFSCPTANANFIGTSGIPKVETGSSAGFVSRVCIPFAQTVNGTSYPATDAKLIRLRPLYNNATMRIVPAGYNAGTGACDTASTKNMPIQSYKVRSEGLTGDTKRVVEVERSIGGVPSILDYVIFNGSSTNPLTKN